MHALNTSRLIAKYPLIGSLMVWPSAIRADHVAKLLIFWRFSDQSPTPPPATLRLPTTRS